MVVWVPSSMMRRTSEGFSVGLSSGRVEGHGGLNSWSIRVRLRHLRATLSTALLLHFIILQHQSMRSGSHRLARSAQSLHCIRQVYETENAFLIHHANAFEEGDDTVIWSSGWVRALFEEFVMLQMQQMGNAH